MKKINLLLITFLLCFNSSNGQQTKTEVYVASTPCDAPLKSILSIEESTTIDFIRWELSLSFSEKGTNSFAMSINYGESKPNTAGFMGGGYRKKAEGTFEISKPKSSAVVYNLKSKDFKSTLPLTRLSNNVLHILTASNLLMVGNGGWSYSLNKKDPKSTVSALPSSLSSLNVEVENNTIRFDGRTPCEPVNSEYNLQLGESCLKVKWKLELSVDPITKKPTTFSWNRTGHRSGPIDGTWVIEKGTSTNPNAIICRLNANKPYAAISMLIADENVMYFLDKSTNIMTGDENFSFALNRYVK